MRFAFDGISQMHSTQLFDSDATWKSKMSRETYFQENVRQLDPFKIIEISGWFNFTVERLN